MLFKTPYLQKHHLFVFTLIAAFFLPGKKLNAQNVIGTVMGDSVRLSGSIIRDKRSRAMAVTDVKGNFHINANYQDTLITTFVGYWPDTVIFRNQPYLTIHLSRQLNVLREVVIGGSRVSPLLQFQKNKEDYKQIYRIGDDHHLLSAKGGYGLVGIGLSIDGLYSLFSKEGKDARRLQRTFVTDYHNSVVDSRFTEAFVAQVTGYKDQQLNDFIMNNRPSYEFVQQASDYEIITYIKRRVNHILSPDDIPTAKTTTKGLNVKFKMPTIDPNASSSRLGAAAGQGRP
jgi:hypothetical protein